MALLLTLPVLSQSLPPSQNQAVNFLLGKGRWPSSDAAGKQRPRLQTLHKKSPRSPIFYVTGEQQATEIDGTAVESKELLGRSSFPRGFVFGAASAAYQIEGGYNEGGRGMSIWDTYTHTHPEKIEGRSNGDVAIDSYHRYKEDVKVLKEMGVDSYRFSISWPRILPKGRGTPNKDGIDYCNNLINKLIDNDITPFVTLFHWDVPQALEDEYGGFLDHRIVEDFKDYSQLCFETFGDRVKNWITLNEPSSFSRSGYDTGKNAPGRCSSRKDCVAGDSTTEPYIVTHNLLLAHAASSKLYKDVYQAKQKGQIGITLVTQWMTPYSKSLQDVRATERSLDFLYGWFIEPLVYGDYPFIMRAIVRHRLPYFKPEESEMLKGSFDFIGINYYTARYCQDRSIKQNDKPTSYTNDSYCNLLVKRGEEYIGDPTGTWLYVYPQGIYDFLVYTKSKYNDPVIYVTENGTCQLDSGDNPLTLEKALDDQARKKYYFNHLSKVKAAMRDGVNVKGYFCWSLMDNFEWSNGYTMRFGLCYVDYKNDLKRIPKASHKWFAKFLRS